MPYVKPPASPESNSYDLPPLKLRPRHRRTRSANPTFSNESGPGAFASLPNLPRHKSFHSERKAVFHIDDQDSDSSDTSPPPEPQSQSNALRLTVDTRNVPSNAPVPSLKDEETSSLPFPSRGSPAPSPQPSSPISSPLPRTPSTPVILANGKPLKPSLKSSQSSPNVSSLRMHTRAQSEPSTPSGVPATPKNVHFAGDDALRSVRVFNSSGRPVNVSRATNAEETETETEYDSSNPTGPEPSSYPFPSIPSPPRELGFELDSTTTSAIPTYNPPMYANVHVETLVLPRTSPPILRGSVIVRNLAFTKDVAVRFTLDNWHTTSEVACKHVISLPSLPPPFPHPHTEGDLAAGKNTWDRFSFIIKLEDFERKLQEKTMWFVVRYTAPGTGEWWDNNSGQNYRVGFKRATTGTVMDVARTSPIMGHSQQRTFSAPPTLKGTPTTEAVQTAAHATPTARLILPQVHGRSHRASMPVRPAIPVRHNSSPQPSLSSMVGSRSSAAPLHTSVPSKLNLMNYAAPSTMTAPHPSSPTRQFVGLSDAAPPSEAVSVQAPATREMNIVGGMPATAPKYDFSWPPSNSSSTQSLSDDTPPPRYSALPPPSELEKQKAKEIVSSPTSSLANDSTYAAFIKQFCFVQSPTPSPNQSPPLSTSSSATNVPRQASGSGWRGLGDAFSGLYGGSGIRSDSPMLTSM
ncbi:hypothetical protein ACEPAI_579 [Sanghuangporus weigelae]